MTFETEHTPPLEIEGSAPPKRRSLFGGLNSLLRTFSPSERLLLYILSVALGVSAFILLANVNEMISTEVPTQGGSLVEGAVGVPRFVNPLLAVSEPDQDLTTLIYSGLLRAKPDGTYIPDLASSYDISQDGTVYTFHLRPNLTFHDGSPLTANDILFTVGLAQNPEIKSPRRADWEGVQVSAPDDHTIVFTLPHAYAPFRENATLGILPKKLWEGVAPSEFPFSSLNTHPIGSGPYRVKDVTLETTGAPTEYRLASFSHFALGTPNITNFTYRLFANDEALIAAYENGDIESLIVSSPKNLSRDLQASPSLVRLPLARTFGVFFNQNHAPALAALSVRQALDAAVDKEEIVRDVLGGYGTVLDGPIPPGLLPTPADASVGGRASLSNTASSTATTSAERIERAASILTRAGWKFSTASSTVGVWTKNKTILSLTLATADTDELVATAHKIVGAWKAVGIEAKVDIYPLNEFNQTILRPRNYDAILFGEVVGRALDLFAFWHSSQRNDPGLNLALYTSPTADKLLALARAENDLSKREKFIRSFVETVSADSPAVFLYAPSLAYIVPDRIRGTHIGTLTIPADRFVNVHEWYRDTERVWNIFSK